MNKEISLQAKIIELSMLSGVITHQECVAWSDDMIAQQKQSMYELIEISMSASLKDALTKLKQISVGADDLKAIQIVLGRMYFLGKLKPNLLKSFAKGLYDFARQKDYIVPKELRFFHSYYDFYGLATTGELDSTTFLNVEEIDQSLLVALSPFLKDSSSKPFWYSDVSSFLDLTSTETVLEDEVVLEDFEHLKNDVISKRNNILIKVIIALIAIMALKIFVF